MFADSRSLFVAHKQSRSVPGANGPRRIGERADECNISNSDELHCPHCVLQWICSFQQCPLNPAAVLRPRLAVSGGKASSAVISRHSRRIGEQTRPPQPEAEAEDDQEQEEQNAKKHGWFPNRREGRERERRAERRRA